jgi:hypothetical protein
LKKGREAREEAERRKAMGEDVRVVIGEHFIYVTPAGAPFEGIRPYQLVEALLTVFGARHFWNNYGTEPEYLYADRSFRANDRDVWLSPANRDILKLVLGFCAQQAIHNYKSGFQAGRSLIQGLASGDVSIKELNERTLQVDEL